MNLPQSLLLTAIAVTSACQSPSALEADGPLSVVRAAYEGLEPGADWSVLREHYAADGRIIRFSSNAPGGSVAMSADEWFAEFGPSIDTKEGFAVRVVGSRATVYDRLASVWATVEVREHDVGKEPIEFRTVEQLSLVLGTDDRWQITQAEYQGEAEGWPAPSGHRSSVFVQSNADVGSGLRFRVSNN